MADTIWWPGLCGNRSQYYAFWSPPISLNTSNPDLTVCMQRSVCQWITMGWLLLLGPISIIRLQKANVVHKRFSFGKLNLAKFILGILMIVLTLESLIAAIDKSIRGEETEPINIMYCTIRTLTLILATYLIRLEFLRGCIASATICIFWLLNFCIELINFRSRLINMTNKEYIQEDSLTFGVELSLSLLVMIQFLISIPGDTAALAHEHKVEDEKTPLLSSYPMADKMADKMKPKPVPELRAGFWMKSFYFWIFPAMVRAYRKPLKFENLYDVRPEDACEATMPVYYDMFKRKAKFDSRGRVENVRWAFNRALFETSGWALFKSQSFKFLSTALFLLNPQLLRMLLSFMESGDPHTWKAVLLSVGIFFASWIGSIIRHNFFYVGWNAGMRARSVVNAVVCRKALRLSATSGKTTTVGEMVNYLSVDAQKIQDMYTFGHFVVDLPIQIVFTVWLLWNLVGWSTISGLVFLGLALLINGVYLGGLIAGHQIMQMAHKDKRLRVINEILNGIKVLKLYAWEPSFHKQITQERQSELKYIYYINMISSISTAIWAVTPYVMSLAIFTLYVLNSENHVLSADIAFVGLSYINTLQFSLSNLPSTVNALSQGIVSGNRIAQFLSLEEMDDSNVQRDKTYHELHVKIEGGHFAWGSEQRSILKSIDLSVKVGEVVAIVGNVGAGKSSLLSSMLGELIVKQGNVKVNGSVAYVPQQAWIQNATLRDNITFSSPYEKSKYKAALSACALTRDLEVLPGGDYTEIGEKGINLSGGQKQRVSLARAVYQDEDIYLLDDPLSAVDAHVGKHIFDNVIGKKGVLKDKTRILATHAITFLPHVDKIIVLKDGRISEEGQYEHLIDNDGDFAEFLRTYLIEQEVNEDSDAELWHLHQRLSALSGDESIKEKGTLQRHRSGNKKVTLGKSESLSNSVDTPITPKQNKQLIEAETSEEGRLKFHVVWTFIKAGGLPRFMIIILAESLFVTAAVTGNLWLSEWTNTVPVNGSIPYSEAAFWAGGYGGLGIVQVIAAIIVMATGARGCTKASETLHGTLLHRILRAPMSFFDTTPLGRIMNRFSKDMDMLDTNTPNNLKGWFLALGPLLSSLTIIIYTTPIFLVVIAALAIPFWFTQRVYITFASQLKRIDSVRRSPIYAHFDETVSGASSIRAYKREAQFIGKAESLIDDSQRPYFMMSAVQRWLGITLETMAAIICFFASLFAAMNRDTIGPGLAGAAISYAFQVTVGMNVIVRTSTELETYMVCVERIDEYSKIQSEAEWNCKSDQDVETWPEEGAVAFRNYGTRYRAGLDLVLKGINLDIKAGSKVGVVGRTGAGKSSLTLALFRIIEAAHGSITIDGIDISQFGLHKLRSKLTVIPQDPVMFSGALRLNLDPFGNYSDAEIWTALERAHLKPFVESLEEGLEYNCGEGGDALSVGQRQLVCLTRALLRQTKVLILDEATAAVDLETDALIQESIRKHFANCTVITVAHRLNTVLDYDKILVLDHGKVKEYDSPSNLLNDKASIFHSLAKEAGIA